MPKNHNYYFSGTKIPAKRISEVWSKEHPRTKQPPVVGYYTSQRELNCVDKKAIANRVGEKGTGEYGKRVAANPNKYNRHADGMCLHGTSKNKSSTILIQKGMPKRHETAVIKHELNHVFKHKR
jgi:hypothetical protein